MRLSGGQARGRKFSRKLEDGVRPPLARIRQSIFSILADRIEGSRVLDLFAGAGTFGLESISRGSREVVLVESRAGPARRLDRSICELGFRAVCRVVRTDALGDTLPTQLQRLAGDAGALPFDIVFVDPPFALLEDRAGVERLSQCLDRLFGEELVTADGVVVLRHARCGVSGVSTGELSRPQSDRREFGRSVVSFYEASQETTRSSTEKPR